MNIIDIINKKREKQELSKEEIEYAINGYLDGSIKDYQMSSLLMAIAINNMTERETFDLTDVMLNSGDKLDLSNIDSMNIYIVRPGDTLWNIAKKYKTSVEKILKTNEDILDPNNINVGQKIFVIR